MAHKAPRQPVRLVRVLRSADHAVVVHVDMKSSGAEWDRAMGELKEIGAWLVDHIDRLLRSDKRYAEYWMRTVIPDELVFQTILGNSRHDISTADHLFTRSGTAALIPAFWGQPT